MELLTRERLPELTTETRCGGHTINCSKHAVTMPLLFAVPCPCNPLPLC
jgi:hypothetical protein